MKLFYIHLILYLFFHQIKCDLELLIELFRHGARTPSSKDIWNSGDYQQEGELTPIGMRQHYILGQNLRNHYINELNFIPSSFDDFELHVRSGYDNRLLQSVWSQLYGLFPLGTGPNLPTGINRNLTVPPFKNYSIVDPEFLALNAALPLNFQPICVHSVLKEEDLLLQGFKKSVCPGAKEIEKQLENTSIYKQIEAAVLPTFKAVGAKINYTHKIDKLKDCIKIIDVFSCDTFTNWALPELNATEWKIMNFASNINIYLQYFQDQYSISFAATPMLSFIVDMFNNKITGATKKKWEIFSAHHENVGFMLAALNMTSHQCIQELFTYNKTSALNCVGSIPFASSLLIELYSNNSINNSYYVKVNFNGDYYYLCEKQSYTCDYNEFITRLKFGILPNWASVCGSNYTIQPLENSELKFHSFIEYLDSLGDKKIISEDKKEVINPVENLNQYLIIEDNQVEKDNKNERENSKDDSQNHIMNIFILGQFILVFVLAGYYFAQKSSNSD